MIKETITYEDFDGVTRTDELHFNMTEFELNEIAMELPDDLTAGLSKDASTAEIMSVVLGKMGKKGIINFIKLLVLKAYGVKGEDGRSFRKSEKISEDFSNTMAFHAFVMHLISDDDASGKFFTGIVPAKLADQIPAEIRSVTN